MIRNHFLTDPESRGAINRAISDEESRANLVFETWNDKGPRYKVTLMYGALGGRRTRFSSLLEPDGFVYIIRLRTYLSRMEE
jgi:hypothetical protein